MHDIALLKQLTEEQLKAVILFDPLAHNNHTDPEQTLIALKNLWIPETVITRLYWSWAMQLSKTRRANDLAARYFAIYDQLAGTQLQIAFVCHTGNASRLVMLKSQCEWHHWVRAGRRALKDNRPDSALTCFQYLKQQSEEILNKKQEQKAVSSREMKTALKGEQAAQKGFRLVLEFAIVKGNMALVKECIQSLNRTLKHPEKQRLRKRLVELLTLDRLSVMSSYPAYTFLGDHASVSEKRHCLNAVAKKGNVKLLEELSVLWNISITEKHLKFALGHHWYTKQNGGNAYMRTEILRELTKISATYSHMLERALHVFRNECVAHGEMIEASEIGAEINKPVTFDEYTQFLRMFGNDSRYTQKQVPFVFEQLLNIIQPQKVLTGSSQNKAETPVQTSAF